MNETKGKTILLVDDEAIIAMSEAGILEKQGYTVLTAFSGEDAIKTAASNPGISLILMDIDLGRGMDGTQAAEIILKTLDIPVLFLSSHTEPDVVAKTEKITSYGYVVKNSGETILLVSIKMAFKLYAAHHELRERTVELTESLTEVCKAEEALKISEKKLSLVFENSPNAITLTDMETSIIVDANKGVEWTGWTREEIVGKSPQILQSWVNPDESQKIRAIMKEKGQVLNYEVDFYKKDGTVAHANMNSVFIRLQGRKYILTISSDITNLKESNAQLQHTKEELEAANKELTATIEELEATNDELQANSIEMEKSKNDIETLLTEHKKSLDELRESEYFLKKSQEIGKIGSFIFEFSDPDPTVSRWHSSPELDKILGIDNTYPRTIQSWLNLYVDRKEVMEYMHREIIEKKGNYAYEFHIKRPSDGDLRWMYGKGEPVLDEQGNIKKIIGTLQDITERKRMEEALRQSEAEFRSLFEFSPIGVCLLKDRRILKVNALLCKMFGYSAEELLGQTTRILYTNEDQFLSVGKEFYDMMDREDMGIIETRLKRKDDRIIDVLISSNPIDPKEPSAGAAITMLDISERKSAEEALKFQNLLLKTQQETSIDGILVVGESRKILSYNNKFAEMWNIPRDLLASGSDDMAFKYILEVLQDPEQFLNKIDYIYDHPNAFSRDEVSFKDGSLFDRYSAPLIGENNQYYGRIWYFRDITEKKHAEEELSRSNELLRAIIEAAPTAIIGLDLDGLVQWVWNSAAEKMLGWRADEVMGQYLPTIDKDKKEEFAAFRQWIQAGQKMNGVDVRRRRKDGTSIDYSIYASPLHDSEGKIFGNIAVMVDIVERKQMEDELKENREIFNLFMKYSPIYIFFKDENLRSMKLSNNYEKMLGMPMYDIIGKSVYDLFPPPLAERMAEDDRKVLREGKPVHVVEEFQGRTYVTDKFPIIREGKLPLLAGFTMDITERKQAEDAVEKSLREKESLLREMQHRMKNSLAIIMGIIELEINRTSERGAQTVLKNLKDRMKSLSNLYTLLFRSDTVTEVGLEEYIPSIVDSLAATYMNGTSTIHIEHHCDRMVVSAKNAAAWGLIVNELLTNALKYAFKKGENGYIRVVLKMENSESVLSISDNGTGPPRDFDIKNPTGFGLLLVKMLAKQLGGSISFARGDENTFILHVPVSPDE